ncbi:hypothetical protein FRC12_007580 [Ceratobasidium sp. 428]|nr:hypothetical protein FRC12_007580 [Ceratobasidium sp. 428]
MPYQRLTETTSMTTAERAKSKRIRRTLNRGEEPMEVMTPPGPPRRPGLRGVQYAYTSDAAPRRVVPHQDFTTNATEEVSIPSLSGHENPAAASSNQGSSVETYYIIGFRPDPPSNTGPVHNYYVLPNRPESPAPNRDNDVLDDDVPGSPHGTGTTVSESGGESEDEGEGEGKSKDGHDENTCDDSKVAREPGFEMLAMLAEQAVGALVRDAGFAHTTPGQEVNATNTQDAPTDGRRK